MALQGQSTLTNDEKITEARRNIAYLVNHLSEMEAKEREFVEHTEDSLRRYGAKVIISNKVLFWIRDLIAKY